MVTTQNELLKGGTRIKKQFLGGELACDTGFRGPTCQAEKVLKSNRRFRTGKFGLVESGKSWEFFPDLVIFSELGSVFWKIFFDLVYSICTPHQQCARVGTSLRKP